MICLSFLKDSVDSICYFGGVDSVGGHRIEPDFIVPPRPDFENAPNKPSASCATLDVVQQNGRLFSLVGPKWGPQIDNALSSQVQLPAAKRPRPEGSIHCPGLHCYLARQK